MNPGNTGRIDAADGIAAHQFLRALENPPHREVRGAGKQSIDRHANAGSDQGCRGTFRVFRNHVEVDGGAQIDDRSQHGPPYLWKPRDGVDHAVRSAHFTRVIV